MTTRGSIRQDSPFRVENLRKLLANKEEIYNEHRQNSTVHCR